jgi:hypothetical protein
MRLPSWLRGISRRGVRPRPAARPGPQVEALEDRRYPSCTLSYSDGTLTILGDNRANTVEVRDLGARGVAVTCDGHAFPVFAAVHTIVIRTGDGSDTVNFLCGDPDQTPAPRSIDIDLGNGNDTFNCAMGDPNERIAIGRLDVTVRGGAANDYFKVDVRNVLCGDPNQFTFYGDEGDDTFDIRFQDVTMGDPDQRLAVNVFAGNGSDRANLNFIGDPNQRTGQLGVLADMGNGDDFAAVNIASIGDPDQVRAVVLGGRGDDLLALNVYASWNGDSGHWPVGVVDGGPGFDTGQHTVYVEAINCEVDRLTELDLTGNDLPTATHSTALGEATLPHPTSGGLAVELHPHC